MKIYQYAKIVLMSFSINAQVNLLNNSGFEEHPPLSGLFRGRQAVIYNAALNVAEYTIQHNKNSN